MNLALLIICHLVGDFLLQNHWMQAKSKDSLVCMVHVAVYSTCFWAVAPWYIVVTILVQHWLQDRFSLHLRWMRVWGHTTPDKWPVGPLCVDQSFHLAAIGIIYCLGGGK